MPSTSRTINNLQLTINKVVNCQLSAVSCQSAFTLVELLVVMGMLGIITGASLLFLTNILKGSNQARIVSEVKQNGQTVLDSVDRQIRNAQEVNNTAPPLGSASAIELVLNGGNLYLACFDSIVGPPAENGWIGIANLSAGPYVSLTNRDEVSGINVICDWDTVSPGTDTFVSLGTSTDPYPQVVKVNFKVKQAVDAPARVDFQSSEQLFSTTISLRKYSF